MRLALCCLVIACSTPPGASDSGTAGGTAGTAGGSTAGGTAGGTSGGAGGGTAGGTANPDAGCTWNDGGYTCPPGQYCNAPGCGAGQCTPIPTTTTNEKQVQCGCDHINWWNASVAAAAGISIDKPGECTDATSCGGIAALQCPAGKSCNFMVADKQTCAGADLGGTCWGMPAQCPQIAIGVHTRRCFGDTCTDECSLVKSGQTWYPSNTCPQ